MTEEERYDIIMKLRHHDALKVQDTLCSLSVETINDILSGPECARVFVWIHNLAPQFSKPFCFTHWRKHAQCPR